MDTERYLKCDAVVGRAMCNRNTVIWFIGRISGNLYCRCATHNEMAACDGYHSLQDALAALAMERL